MKSVLWLLAPALCAISAAAAAPDTESLALLNRIRLRMAENLRRLPNYTCSETIERSRRRSATRRFELDDVMRLEVALVDGKELFAWPGATKFDDRDVTEIVGSGTISNGSFALHARSVFLSQVPTFHEVGKVTLEGAEAYEWTFEVPQFRSGYKIHVKPNEAIVGYRGHFWVNAQTLDLIRLTVEVPDPPPSLGIAKVTDVMNYQVARIGEGMFLLPASSELVMTDFRGAESRNRTGFSNCRQYSGDSVLSFGDAPEPGASAPAAAQKPVLLPPGVLLEISLQTPIRSETAITGDAVEARLLSPAKSRRELVAPKGALLRGRLALLRKQDSPRAFFIVGIAWESIEFDGRSGPLQASLEQINDIYSFSRVPNVGIPGAGAIGVYNAADQCPRCGVLFAAGTKLNLQPGLRMLWRSQPLPQEKPHE